MAITEGSSRDVLLYEAEIEDAIKLIQSGNYQDAYDVLSRSQEELSGHIDKKYRDNSLLVNNLGEDIAEELSAAANPEKVSDKRLERSQERLTEFANNYLE